MEKNVYEAPKLEEHGTIEEMTLANSTGSQLDQAQPGGTHVNNLLLS